MKVRKNKEVAEIAYMLLKEYEICVRCKANWAEKKHVLCKYCAQYWRDHRAAVRRNGIKLYVMSKAK